VGEIRAEVQPMVTSVKSTSEAARTALTTADRVIAETGARVNEIAPSVRSATDAAEGALVQAKETLAMREGVVGKLATSLLDTLAAARSALDTAEKTLVQISGLAAVGSEMGTPVQQSLEEIRAMSRAIRTLSDYLERHPESLLRGKSSEGN
jgi:paraquat-inducible protein B